MLHGLCKISSRYTYVYGKLSMASYYGKGLHMTEYILHQLMLIRKCHIWFIIYI